MGKNAIFLDVDGTLTDDKSAWEKVHGEFGLLTEMEIHTKRFFAGEITYNEWAEIDTAMWIGKPYKRLQSALKSPNLRKGAAEGVRLLQDAGYDVVLVSGGIDEMVKEVAKMVNADSYYANTIGHKDGIIDGSVHIKVGNSKSDIVTQICVENNYDLEYCGAIGDNVNDVDMFKLVKHSIAINTDKPLVIAAATDHIKTENFLDAANKILEHLNNNK